MATPHGGSVGTGARREGMARHPALMACAVAIGLARHPYGAISDADVAADPIFNRVAMSPPWMSAWLSTWHGPKSKGATTIHTYGGDFLHAYPGRTIEPRGMKDKGSSRPAMPRPTAPSTAIQAPALKKLTRDELRERSAKGLCWNYDEP
ncbi:hypothetical protein B296_00031329 [Ensete ventricosum]|uniref:Uncharacterized protein n=1 Tax=Ensete ventricosum TaxID=4639 RepID=A0A426X971_ENSVE|nr:hypothetical protein B296_00031329 [Ensete ventricosum]